LANDGILNWLTIDRMQCAVVDELMQPSVHALVLVAQSQAGMWRRNGFSLQNQVIL